MSQVSRKYLPPKVSGQIFEMFISTLSSLSSRDAVSSFVEDLLSPTEQIMLGKRLAIAYMIKKGYSQRSIVGTLKVGLSTVNKISLTLKGKNNGYQLVVDRMLRVEKIRSFFDKIEEKIDHLLPPKGTNWSAHYQRTNQARSKRKKSF